MITNFKIFEKKVDRYEWCMSTKDFDRISFYFDYQ